MTGILVAAVVGYLLGSIPFGLIVTRLAGLGDVRQIGSGSYNATYIGPDSSSYDPSLARRINDNTVPSATYVNLSASYQLREPGATTTSVEVFGSINNLFDRDPPPAPGGNGYPTNPVYFDTYGAAWKLGVRARF